MWEKKRERRSVVHYHQPTITGPVLKSTVIGSNHATCNIGTMLGRKQRGGQKRKGNNNQHEKGTTKRIRVYEECDQSDIQSGQYQSDSGNDNDSQYNDEEEIDDDVDPNDIIPTEDEDDVPGSGELEHQESMPFPADDSSPDIWILPSGLSVAEAIRPQFPLPIAHPSYMGIIRIGANIRRPEWIQRSDWNCLQSSVATSIDPLSEHIQDFFKALCETESLEEYAEVIEAARTKRKNDQQLLFYLDVLGWFATTVFSPASTFNSPRAQESVLGSLLLHPVIRYLANVNGAHYLPREIHLHNFSATFFCLVLSHLVYDSMTFVTPTVDELLKLERGTEMVINGVVYWVMIACKLNIYVIEL